jgi:cytochrome c553
MITCDRTRVGRDSFGGRLLATGVAVLLLTVPSLACDSSAAVPGAQAVAGPQTPPGFGPPPVPTDAPEHWPASFSVGRDATEAEIDVMDKDVRPDGAGLPPGGASVAQGALVYATKCAVCHGATGTEGPNDRLVGREPREGFPFGSTRGQYRKTVGNYWPYATTIFDYVTRTMPLGSPGSLEPDEVYGATAYILFMNEVIPEDAVMNAETLPAVIMPARDRFVPDNRMGGPEIR